MQPHVIVFLLATASSVLANFVIDENCHSPSNKTHASTKDDLVFFLETINKGPASIAEFSCLCRFPSGSVLQVDRRSGKPEATLYTNNQKVPVRDPQCLHCLEANVVFTIVEGDLFLACEFSDVATSTSKTTTTTTTTAATKRATTKVLLDLEDVLGKDFLQSMGLVPLEEDPTSTTTSADVATSTTKATTKRTTTEVLLDLEDVLGKDVLQSMGLVPLEEDPTSTTISGKHSTTPTSTPTLPVTDMVRGDATHCWPLGWLSVILVLGLVVAM